MPDASAVAAVTTYKLSPVYLPVMSSEVVSDTILHPSIQNSIPSDCRCIQDEEGIRQLLPTLIPGWGSTTVDNIAVERIPTGITNKIYKATDSSRQNATPLLVRIFGGQDVFTDAQRRQENELFNKLGMADIAPRLIALFGNGRVEQFKNARALKLDEMTAPYVAKGLGKALARLHSFGNVDADESLEPKVWTVTKGWAMDALRMYKEGAFKCHPAIDVPALVEAMEAFKHKLVNDRPPSKVVFAHNDLLHNNILVSLDGKQEISLVDFEYGSLNYRGFDIGNFFCEAMGGTEDGHIQTNRYPSAAIRHLFCQSYLQQVIGAKPNEHEVQELMAEAEEYARLANLYWGFWALVQSAGSDIDFPYVSYAEQRFAGFYVKERPA